MSIRRKIALWIDPSIDETLRRFWKSTDEKTIKIMDLEHRLSEFAAKTMISNVALNNIIALKTPNCASIGKRMAQIAEEALK